MLVSATNTYLQTDGVKLPLVEQVSRYVFKVLVSFGVYDQGSYPSVGDETGNGAAEGSSVEDAIAPVVNALSQFRDLVKQKAPDGAKAMFEISDQLRDDVLPHLGIRLEDRKKDQPAIWKFADKNELLAEREAKLAKIREAEEAKRLKKELEIIKKSTPGSEWFKVFPDHKDGTYTKFNEDGLPTHTLNKKGEEKALSEAQQNGLKKIMKKQEGVYSKWEASQQAASE